MILKASQRAGGKQLGLHLGRTDENDHVEVHEIRGFVSGDVVGAMHEAYAISRGTRCKQYLFSVSLSPPQFESVDIATFEDAIDRIEEQCGLVGQPRVIVFHEKNGRRHAHCVWSRINAQTMKAVNLPHFKLKLREVSRELFVENDWEMPRGMLESAERDPLNFTRAEWQQAMRAGRDPKVIKKIFQDCWALSDSAKAFDAVLKARGFHLAQGDRRTFVALDHKGEIYAVARWVGIKTKVLNERLGDPGTFPTATAMRKEIAQRVSAKMDGFREELFKEFETARTGLLARKRALVVQQRSERQDLRDLQAARHVEESRTRQLRFRSGLKGLWDWITGDTASVRAQNEREWQEARKRDEQERLTLIDRQLQERRALQRQLKEHEARRDEELAMIRQTSPDLPSPARKHGQERVRIRRKPDQPPHPRL